MGNILFPNIIKMPPQSSESQLYEVDIGIFHREALDSRNIFVLNPPPPPPGGNPQLCAPHPIYNPPGWCGGLPLMHASNMCIIAKGILYQTTILGLLMGGNKCV